MVEYIEIKLVVVNKVTGDYLKGGYIGVHGNKPNPSWERNIRKSFIKFPEDLRKEANFAANQVDGEVFEIKTVTRITVTRLKEV